MNMRIQTKGARPYEIKGLGDSGDDLGLEEIMAAIEELTKSTKGGMGDFEKKLKLLETQLNRLTIKSNRPQMGGGGSDPAELEAERKNFNAFVRGDFKTMQVAIDPQGGYFVPDVLQSTMTEKLYDPPTLLGLVRTEQWDGPGSDWIEPLKRALLTARRRTTETEPAQDTSQANPIGLLTVPADEAEAMIEISQKLIDDSARDISAMVVADMEASFDRQIDAEIVAGNGVGKAQGFLTLPIVSTDDSTRPWGQMQYVPTGNTSGLNTTSPADAIKTLFYTLRAPYRQGATWVMNSATANVIDQIKDGQGRYIWRDSLQDGVPPTLLGKPVAFDENMPAIGAGAYPLAFGNWKLGYLVAKKNQTRLLRDPYTSKPNLVLYGYKRQGGQVANSEAIKLLKIATS